MTSGDPRGPHIRAQGDRSIAAGRVGVAVTGSHNRIDLRRQGVPIAAVALLLALVAGLTVWAALSVGGRGQDGGDTAGPAPRGQGAPPASAGSAPSGSTAAASAGGGTGDPAGRHTGAQPGEQAGRTVVLKESNSPLTSANDKIDLDSGSPGHGPQPQLIAHPGGPADLFLEPERLHSYDDAARLLLLSASGPAPTPHLCDSRLSAPDAPLTGSIPMEDLPAGARLCVRTDHGRAVGVTVTEAGTAYPTHLILTVRTTAAWAAS